MNIDIETILAENTVNFGEMSKRIKRGENLFEVCSDYKELAEKIGVGVIGLTHYLERYMESNNSL